MGGLPHDSALKTIDNLVDLLEYRAACQSDQKSHIFLRDGDDEEEIMTYRQLAKKAKMVACRLLEKTRPGDRALLLYPPGLDYIVAYFGCLYAGVTAVPVYPPDPLRLKPSLLRLKAVMENAAPKLLLTESAVVGMVDMLFSQGLNTDRIDMLVTDKPGLNGQNWIRPALDGSTLAFLQYTSGSTGSPKGVMVTHANLMQNMAMTAGWYEIDKAAHGVSWLPPYHDMGLIGGILQPIYQGVPVTLMSPLAFLQKPYRWLRAITRYRANVTAGPNFAFELCNRKITSAQIATLNLSALEMVVNGAEPIRLEVLDQFAKKFEPCGFNKMAFSPAYGLAENTLFCTGVAKADYPRVVEIDQDALISEKAASAGSDSFQSRAVSCGTASPDQRILIVDPKTHQTCPEGKVGEIWISGPCVAQGYWGDPQLTDEIFKARLSGVRDASFLRTGDLGILQDGSLFVTGRLKDLILIRGKNHYPQDIELTVAQSHSALRPGCGAAFSIDSEGEEQLVIIQELKNQGDQVAQAASIIQTIRQKVAEIHLLNAYEVLLIEAGTIPKTSSGKIQRHACRKWYQQERFKIVGPRNFSAEKDKGVAKPMGAAACGISKTEIVDWILEKVAFYTQKRVTEIDRQQSLLAFGVDSMTLIGIHSEINTAFDVDLPLSCLTYDYSLEELAANLARLKNETQQQRDEALLAEIEHLSEAEIDALLAAV